MGEGGNSAEEILATAKTDAKTALNNYKDAADYTTNAAELEAAITAGEEAIDAATKTEDVTTALNNAKGAIDEIKSDAQLATEALALATAKTNAKTALNNYKDAADYTTNAAELEAAITAGEEAIDAATKTEGVTTALDNAKLAIDEIKSDAQLATEALATAKTNAKTELEGYVKAEDYTTNVAALTTAIADGKTAIDAATKTEDVTTALNNAQLAIDAIKSDAELVADAIAAVNNAGNEALEDALKNEVLGLDLTNYLYLNTDQRVDMAGDLARNFTTVASIQTALNAQVLAQAYKEIKWAADNGDWSGAKVSMFTAAGVTGVTAQNYDAVKQALQDGKATITDKESIQTIVDGVNDPA